MNGIFVRVKYARGKKALDLVQNGLPIQVSSINKDRTKAYVIPADPNNGKDKSIKEDVIYYDIKMGRVKHERLFVTVEASGKTLDFIKDANKNMEENSHTSVAQEEVGVLKQALRLWAEAMQGSFKTIILPIITGLGLGWGSLALILLMLGRLR